MTEAKKAGVPEPKILLVDDMPANLDLLSGMLKSRGYRIRAAVSGEAALAAAQADQPDLVLLDVNMPGMDGYEVCRRLKADERTREVPVIFLSALNETLDKVKAFGSGGVDYVSKPFQFEEVEARVRTHLELRLQKLELRRSYEELRKLETMRDGLVHMIVHDLRSPLAAISIFIESLEKDLKQELSPDAAEDLAETRKATGVLMRMVSDVLDASKMESGKMKLSLSDCDLREVMEGAALSMRPLAGSREVILEPGPAAPLRADRELLTRVLQNLLANAFKYAPRSGGRVVLRVEPAASGYRASVENNGPAIPEQYFDKIFEKFGQVDEGGRRQPFSTGLGLSFCKMAVEAHGGRIGVRSAGGAATLFWFELGAAAPAPAEERS